MNSVARARAYVVSGRTGRHRKELFLKIQFHKGS